MSRSRCAASVRTVGQVRMLGCRVAGSLPSTPGGMAEIAAPTLGHGDTAMATAAATKYAAVEYTGVAAMTPMFSAYVVVADPPPKPANVVATPSAASTRPIIGSTSVA